MADMNRIGGLHYEMMRRCYNPKSVAYKDYGAKGIRVCDEWHDRNNFRKWANENGFRKGLRLERIDSAKDYCPDNCRFGEARKGKNGKSKRIRESAKAYRERLQELGIDGFSGHPLYKILRSMHKRCEYKRHPHYDSYGGKGIKVCIEWSGKDGAYNFIKWSLENGWEEGLTIDRIDNEKGYSPDNCRWATMKEQIINRRCINLYDFHGELLCASDIASRLGVDKHLVYYRLKKGWSIEEIEKHFEKRKNCVSF